MLHEPLNFSYLTKENYSRMFFWPPELPKFTYLSLIISGLFCCGLLGLCLCGPNLALNQPTFCKEESTDYQNCKLEWVNMAIRVVEVSKLEQFLPKNQH